MHCPSSLLSFAVEIDGQDAANMSVRQIMEVMASKVSQTRRLTVESGIALPPSVQEETTESD